MPKLCFRRRFGRETKSVTFSDTGRMMRILHLLSQRPDATGSGIYVQAMLREARAKGHQNFLVAGIDPEGCDLPADISEDTVHSWNLIARICRFPLSA